MLLVELYNLNKEDNVNNLNECDEIMHNNVLLDDENDIKFQWNISKKRMKYIQKKNEIYPKNNIIVIVN